LRRTRFGNRRAGIHGPFGVRARSQSTPLFLSFIVVPPFLPRLPRLHRREKGRWYFDFMTLLSRVNRKNEFFLRRLQFRGSPRRRASTAFLRSAMAARGIHHRPNASQAPGSCPRWQRTTTRWRETLNSAAASETEQYVSPKVAQRFLHVLTTNGSSSKERYLRKL
jgi:hypothetical protein